MSKVYSFRLSEDNPREAQAMEVINTWVSQGYSLRQIVTNALIEQGEIRNKSSEWEKMYDQLSELVRFLENREVRTQIISDNHNLSQDFVSAMKKAAKVGIRNE